MTNPQFSQQLSGDLAGTPQSNIIQTIAGLGAATFPNWQKFTVPYTALQTAALTNAVTILMLPIKGIVQAAFFNVTQLFSGTAIATITLSVGPTGNLTKYAAANSIATIGLTAGIALTTPIPENMSGTTNIQVNAIAIGANLSVLTQGSVDVYLLMATVT